MALRRSVTTPHPGSGGDVIAVPSEPAMCKMPPSLGRQKSTGYYDMGGGDWFMDLFGFREMRYEDVLRRLRVSPDGERRGCEVMEGENGKVYKVGQFSTPSLRELESSGMQKGGFAAVPGKLLVRNMRGDVSMSLADPENRHATFQVASQFNCLEYVCPDMLPEHGVTRYIYDKTQGPACCVACGPATVYRNYFAKVRGVRGQRRDRQVNTLQELSDKLGNRPEGRYFRMVGGYTLADDDGLRALCSELETLSDREYEALRKELRVGLHEDVQVTSCSWGVCPVEDDEHTVTQVLGSACSVSYSDNSSQLWEPLARLVLSASYEATLWSALLTAIRHRRKEGSTRVFLTSLGGGVFGNRSAWITDAMEEAFKKFKNCGLEVYIVTYSGPYDRHLQRLEKDFCGK